MSRAPLRAAASVLVILLLTAACGDSDESDVGPTAATASISAGDSTAVEPLPPCSLVSRGQAEQVLGLDVDEPRLSDDGTACIYEETDPNGLGGTVLVSQPDGFELFDSVGGEYDEIADLGDETRHYHSLLALVVQREERFVSIELRTSNNAPEDLDVATGFAEHALSALP